MPSRRLWHLLATVMAFMAVAVAAAPSAEAHAELLRTSPAKDASLAQAPDEVVLTFNEPPIGLGSTVRVTSPGGVVSEGPVRVIDNTVHQIMHAGLGAGRYTVTWRVTSNDGHPVSGIFTFTVKGAEASGTTPAPTPSATAQGNASSAQVGAPPEKSSGSSPLPWIAAGALSIALAALATTSWATRRRTEGKA
jgi:methionine-rich copper-binding protein CopC